MADSNYVGGPLPSACPFAPTPPSLRHQDQDTLTPSYPAYNHFSPYDAQAYHPMPGPYRLQLPEPYSAPHAYGQNRFHHFPMHPHRPNFYSSPNGMFQNRPDGAAASGMAPSHLNGVHMAGGPQPDFLAQRNANDMLMLDPPLQSPMHGYSSPPAGHWYPSHLQQMPRRGTSMMSSALPQTPSRYGGDAMRADTEGRGPMRRTESVNGDTPRHMASPPRRPAYDRHHYLDSQVPGPVEPRSSVLLIPPTRRVDRSVSPRTSNRRSFDRYSTDLSQSGNPPETHDAAPTPGHRARRPRTMGFGGSYRARVFSHQDPNIPTTSQMQNLKDKLRHFLPSELPEDASPTCDICQKDYSAKHVLPTEEEEVAIQLPCKHVFGEHCINTWFETCKTHKNKITCPMCRKLLIEPHKSGPEMMRLLQSVHSADRHVFERLLGGDELRGEERQMLENVVARELEGDFAHS